MRGIDSIEKAASLLQSYLFIPESSRVALQEGEILVDDYKMVGSQVMNVKGENLGKVVDFFHNGWCL